MNDYSLILSALKVAVCLLQAIFMMRGTEDPEALAEDAVEELFLHLDKNQDNMISQMEFMVAAKHSKTIVRLLQGV